MEIFFEITYKDLSTGDKLQISKICGDSNVTFAQAQYIP